MSNWGKDIVIPKIEYTTYHKYINERFRRKNLEISLEDATFLQDMMNRNPENINIVCNDILQNNKNIQISQETILISKEHVLFYREGRFQEYLKSLTESISST